MQYLKKSIKYLNIFVLFCGLLIPLILFLNRFLIPDVSFDSINYHLYLGFKGLNVQNNVFEFYPTGIHNFSTVLDIPGYLLSRAFGYRIGSVTSLLFLYLSIFVIYKIFRLYKPTFSFVNNWWSGIMFISMFLSFESFLQIATYYIDIEVSFLMLSSLYLLLRYEKTRKLFDLILSSVFVSAFVLGKMTSWYFLFPYFSYLVFILFCDKKSKLKIKLSKLFIVVSIAFFFVTPWLYKNYVLTRNPVFPFYNGVFKSDYSSKYNFSQVIFGGRNALEKIFYGVFSIKDPVRLGEVHDLFTDYKINIYFFSSLSILIWSVIRKKSYLIKLSVFYLFTYECWGYFFGYLRYGLILEFLGGLLLLFWFSELQSKKGYFVIIPIFLLMVLQGKRIVNLSLAYDISFRPGFFYNRETYPKEIVNFNNNVIKVDDLLTSKYKPNVYLNCVIPGMTFYVLSEFNDLPVYNIDSRAYNDLVLNEEYSRVSKYNLKKYLGNNKIRFVTITSKDGLENGYVDCVQNLKNKNYSILNEVVLDNFLGYKGQKLVYIFGEYSL